MLNVNGTDVFDKRILFSTERVIFDNDKLVIAKNIKEISNTTTKFNFMKKVFNAMKKFSTLLMMSQSGRMGIENRKGDFFRYEKEVNVLNSRFDQCIKNQNENLEDLRNKDSKLKSLIKDRSELKKILLNNDVFNNFIHDSQELELIINNPERLKGLINNNEGLKNEIDNNENLNVLINTFLKSNRIEIETRLKSAIDFKNKLIMEEKKIDHFLSLIENENVSFKDRYGFFNYLNELKRAESFCRQSSNISDKRLADVFKNIFEERILRIKESDIKKIYSEVINTYHYETFFLKENKSVLAHFSSNNEKEKFLSKINFLVSISESPLDALSNIFNKNVPDKLHEIMHTILNEEYRDVGKIISYRDTKDTWIKEYMNNFYEGEKKITTTKNVGINTDSEKEITTQSAGINTDSDITSVSSLSADTSSIHSSGYSADISHNDSELRKKVYFNSSDKLEKNLKAESSNLLNKDASIIQKAIRNMLSKLYDLSSIVTESLSSPQSENRELMISLEKITDISNIIHNIQEQLNNIESGYSVELGENKSFYSKIKASTENIADMFSSMADIIESSNSTNLSFIREEIENTLKNIFGEINYSMLVGKKELLDNIIELITTFIGDSNGSIGRNNKTIVDKRKNDAIKYSDKTEFDFSNSDLEWDNISLGLTQDDANKEILSSLINSIMELDESLEKKNTELELQKMELNTLNDNKLKTNKDYYKLTYSDEGE